MVRQTRTGGQERASPLTILLIRQTLPSLAAWIRKNFKKYGIQGKMKAKLIPTYDPHMKSIITDITKKNNIQ